MPCKDHNISERYEQVYSPRIRTINLQSNNSNSNNTNSSINNNNNTHARRFMVIFQVKLG